MSEDRNYCMSSYLAFRNILDDDKDFCDGVRHIVCEEQENRYEVHSAQDIDDALNMVFSEISNKHLGLCLSGGMDSASLCSYMHGSEAYTFRYLGGSYQSDELKRAVYYANRYNLNLHYVDIDWDTVEGSIDLLMLHRGAPIHSIEPQLYELSQQAIKDGVELLVTGIGADTQFGGQDKLMEKDWSFEEFVKRFMYVDPREVLVNPVDMSSAFEPYRDGEGIDYFSFMKADREYLASYYNAFSAAGIPFMHAYENVRMAEPLDIKRIRSGESKYLIRELFTMKYPEIPVPNKVPMPRPVDIYFKDWAGPSRPEFIKDLDMRHFTGDQKWLIWCLEHFLNLIEPIDGKITRGGVLTLQFYETTWRRLTAWLRVLSSAGRCAA